MEEELDNDAVRHQFNLNSKFFTKEALEGFEDLIIGNVSRTVRYADDLVLLAKEGAVLQEGMTDRLIEIGISYGMEMNVEITKVIRISRQPPPLEVQIDQKQPQNVEYFNYVVTNDVCTCEIKSRITMAKAAFNKNKAKL